MADFRPLPGGYMRGRRPMKYLPPIKSKYIGTTDTFDWSEMEGRQLRRSMDDTFVHGAARYEHRLYCSIVTGIAKSLTRENVDDMRFLARDYVNPPELLLDVRTPDEMLAVLEGQKLLAENSLVFLQMLLYYIGRLDLYNMVIEFRRSRQKELAQRGFDISNEYQVKYEDPERIEIAKDLARLRRKLKIYPKRRTRQEDRERDLAIEMMKLQAKMLETENRLLDTQAIAHAVTQEKRCLQKLKLTQEIDEADRAYGVTERQPPHKQESMTKRIRRLRRSLGLEEVPKRRSYRHEPPVMLSLPDIYDKRLSRIVAIQKY
ncbi:uncharacterized protein LOC144452906 [Glandiceps talaboti]